MKTEESKVPEEAEQVSEIRSRWEWVESSVWTDRMLEALEGGINGVKETKWFCLIDKVYKPSNLQSAYMKTLRNKGAAGVDHVTVKGFGGNQKKNLVRMHKDLKESSYSPSRIRRTYIPKPGSAEKRPLGIPTVRDRIAQTAVRHVIEPIFEQSFAEHSYGFRPQRGCKDALREVNRLLKEGYQYVIDADLRKCFDRIPHEALMDRVTEKVADRKVLSLIRTFLRQEILDGGAVLYPETSGTPQGATLSPLLCNIYLNPFDHLMADAGFQMIRYADDFVVLCKSKEETDQAMEIIKQWLEANGLELHPEKTCIVEMNKPMSRFDFLGYRFYCSRHKKMSVFASPKSQKRYREKLKRYTRRANGKSMEEIIKLCNLFLKGWFEYFKHSSKWIFQELDGWLRMRLRSILRKRMKKRGRGRGSDHHRWPNRYFRTLGLFSLDVARAEALVLMRGCK